MGEVAPPQAVTERADLLRFCHIGRDPPSQSSPFGRIQLSQRESQGAFRYAINPNNRPRKIQKVRVKAEHTVVITMTLAVRVPSWPRFLAMM